MDRNFKLRQMFSDYLEIKAKGSTNTPPSFPSPDMLLSSLSDEEKKRALCKKITEEEAEVLDYPENPSLVYTIEPSFELKWYKKMDAAAMQSHRADNEEEQTAKLAMRLLQVLLKTEMLESATFKYDDIRAIRVFFMDDREMATERLVSILDNIFSVSMVKLGQFSDRISVTVDYELRAFIADAMRAKRTVLEAMLKYPENIPDSWGGEAAIMKWKEAKEADVRRRESDEREREKELEQEKKDKEEKEQKKKEKEEKEDAKKKEREEKEKEKEEQRKKEKEERIRKEVEEAEKKKKEEKEKRKKEKEEQKKKDEKRKEEEEKKKKEEKKDDKKDDKKEETKKIKKKKGNKKNLDASHTKTREYSREPTIEVLPPVSPNHPPTPNHPATSHFKKHKRLSTLSREASTTDSRDRKEERTRRHEKEEKTRTKITTPERKPRKPSS